jgi:hypothetical protein
MTVWRKSSFSGGGGASGGNCVEVAPLPGSRIAFRDSKNPAAVVIVTCTSATAWLKKFA